MKLIALTGGIGAGKSTVSAELSRLGACVIDSDKVSVRLMQPGEAAYCATVKEFGEQILCENGEIDRKALAEIVFSDKSRLEALNKITHPLIYREMQRLAALADNSVVCMEIPLLFSTDCPIIFDMTVAVVAPRETRIERVMRRDGCTREQAEARIANQLPDEQMRSLADYVIENNGDVCSVNTKTAELYRLLTTEGSEE